MAATPTKVGDSYVFLMDLEGGKVYSDEIKVFGEGDRTLVIDYWHNVDYDKNSRHGKKKFDLPQSVNMDTISAVTQNGVLMVTVKKVVTRLGTTPRTIKVTNA
ncbi:hypothetical protein MKW94_021531 [Papaver nudicaule]|uniref:SHSP domain-containing protein n=1 Tax=Papaver nudicaule TaxID=74823 RepID=A0AA41VYR9_PAPNU|nr:hypothetical protein [Papaver nudicaule]